MGPDLVLSNGDLTISQGKASADWQQAIATLGRSTGKYYFEVYVNSGTSVVTIGIQDGTENFDSYTGDSPDGWGFMSNSRFYNAGVVAPVPYTDYTTGDIIGVAVDLDAHKIWWSKNGTWISTAAGTANPVTGAYPGYSNLYSAAMYPAGTVYLTTDQIIGRFKASDQTYSVPSGFVAWES